MGPIGLALLLLAGLAIALAVAVWHTARTLQRPPRRTYAWAIARSAPSDPSEVRSEAAPSGFPFESWTLRTRALDLPVWDIPGLRPDGPTVVFTHGWGDSRTNSLHRLPTLAASASRVIMWDLPGHGDADGTSSLGVREPEDLLALVSQLSGPADRPIVLCGFSLGAGVSIAAAAAGHPAIAGVVAEAPYRIPIVPARNVIRAASLPWRVPLPLATVLIGARYGQGLQWATARRGTIFDRAALASKVRVPLLVIHGDHDAVCPIEDGRDIAAAAPRGTFTEIGGAGHLDLWTNPAAAPRVREAVAAFISQTGASAPRHAEPVPAATSAPPPAGR